MIYKHALGERLSAFGLGTELLPRQPDEIIKIISCAIEGGVNYFDISGLTPEMSSLFGKALSRYSRESYMLASSMPTGNKSAEDAESGLSRRLSAIGTDYFDFYIVPDIDSVSAAEYTLGEKSAVDCLISRKAEGKIRHLGFSLSGSVDDAKRFLDTYYDDMEFCQIPLNWLNWESESREKVEFLADRAIPLWVTDATAGGRLSVPTDDAAKKLSSFRPDEAPDALAFRFIQSLPTVTVTVQSAESHDALRRLIDIMSLHQPLAVWELPRFLALARGINK